MAVTKLIMSAGVEDVILCDSRGAVYQGRKEGMNPYKEEIARVTNTGQVKGGLRDALKGADVFLGLSIGNQVDQDMVKSMNPGPVVFAMANPDPEILPDAASAAGARIIATGRSDYRNQINNVLGFPGIFRGALDVQATVINQEMKIAAAYAIASLAEDKLAEDYIIVSPLNEEVMAREAAAVARAAIETGVARLKTDPDEVYNRTKVFTRFCRERFPLDDALYNKLSRKIKYATSNPR
jgi:malate dehydrogenase (oxaloacetate-decarboxylating)